MHHIHHDIPGILEPPPTLDPETGQLQPNPCTSWPTFDSRWEWNPAEPYLATVRILRASPGGDDRVWAIGRDLIQAGLVAHDRPVGGADVTLDVDGPSLRVQLCAPSGAAALRFSRATVSTFLARTLDEAANGQDAPTAEPFEHMLEALAGEQADPEQLVVTEAERVLHEADDNQM